MLTTLLMALGLALVLEGILPFASPVLWRNVFAQVARMTDGQIRSFGLISIVAGLVLFTLAS